MSFLVYSSSPGFRLPVPRLAPEQLNLGPFVEDEVVGGRLNSLRVPKGDHDLATSIIKVPVDQLPEAVVFIWDGSGAHRPRNLVIFPCPKVLLVASLGPGAKLLSSLVDYIASEKFDRVVAVSGRSQYQLLQAMGIRNLFWFPGLLFPHGDEVVRSAQKQAKEERIAMVGSIERSSSRRQRLGGLLADAAMPLDLEQPGPLDILGFCAKSLITFDALGQGGLTLRIFKAVASGSMVLSERLLAKEQHPLWREGAEWVTFGSPDELLERARYFIGDPPEARRIGERGARWFMEHFNEKRRMAAFQDLVFNGRSLPEFKVPGMAQSANVSWDRRRLEGVLSVRDEVRAAHVAQEAVQVVSDRTLSQDFERLLSSMPRVTVLGAGPEEAEKLAAGAFLLVTSRTTKLSSAVSATHAVWIWDALPEDFAALQGPFSAAGFQAPYAGVCYFRKPAPRRDAPDPLGELARIHLQNGEGAKALEAAMKALAQGSAEAHFVAAEIALERGDGELFTDLLKRARSISPEDPRCALLELHSVRSRRNARETERLLALGWKSAGDHDAPVAMSCARAALKLEPSLVDAHHLGACSALQLRVRGDWKVHGKALQSLQTACELSRGRPDLWHDLAVALRVAGGTVTKAVPAYREALRLDPESATDWFGLGEVLLALDRADEALEAFREGQKRAPLNLGMTRWLGNAQKKLGRLDDAHASHTRGHGRRGSKNATQAVSRTGRKRVVFVVQNGHSWPCMASVHAAFAADPAWEAIVVGLPWIHPSFVNSSTKDQNKVFEFLEEKRIPHVRWDAFPLVEKAADLVFLQNPYDSTRPEGWRVAELQRAGHRLCYVPYAIEFGGDHEDVLYQFNLPLQQVAYAVFARSEAHKRLFAEHCVAGNRHVVVAGHPKFDDIGRPGAVAPDPEMVAFAAGRPLVLWTPHFDVKLNGTRFSDGYSTFLRWHEFLLAEFESRRDMAVVVRPHPTFFSAMEERGILSRAELDAFVARCDGSGNMLLHRKPDYFPLLAAADALVSDASSVLLEFGVSGKPVCYLHNPCGPVAHAAYELDLDYIRDRFTWATSEVQIRAFLDLVPELIAGDEGREGRAEDLRRRMGMRPEGIGATIKRSLEARLAPKAKAVQTVAV